MGKIEIFEWSSEGGSYNRHIKEDNLASFTEKLEINGFELKIQAISGWRLYQRSNHRIIVSMTSSDS